MRAALLQLPFLLKGTLREYQHIGLDWLVTLYHKRLNGGWVGRWGLQWKGDGARAARGRTWVYRIHALSPNLSIRPSIPCTRRHCVKPAAAADMFLSLPCSASRCLPPLPSSGRRCLQASLLTRWGWARQSRPSPCWRTWPAKSEPAAAAAAAAAMLQLLLLLLLCQLAAS